MNTDKKDKGTQSLTQNMYIRNFIMVKYLKQISFYEKVV